MLTSLLLALLLALPPPPEDLRLKNGISNDGPTDPPLFRPSVLRRSLLSSPPPPPLFSLSFPGLLQLSSKLLML